MGIDLLDIKFRLERSCGVKIGVEDFARLAGWELDAPIEVTLDLTVAQIHTYLLERRDEIKTLSAQRPIVQARVESLLRDQRLDRWRSPEPEESLEEMIPRLDRRADWERLADSLNCKLPPLESSRIVKLAVASPLLVLTIAITLAGWSIMHAIDPVWIGLVVIIVGWLAGAFAIVQALTTCLDSRRVRIPAEVATVRQLVDHVTTNRLFESDAPLLRMSDDEVFAGVRDALVECLVVDPDEVTPEAKLVADLGMC